MPTEHLQEVVNEVGKVFDKHKLSSTEGIKVISMVLSAAIIKLDADAIEVSIQCAVKQDSQ